MLFGLVAVSFLVIVAVSGSEPLGGDAFVKRPAIRYELFRLRSVRSIRLGYQQLTHRISSVFSGGFRSRAHAIHAGDDTFCVHHVLHVPEREHGVSMAASTAAGDG